MDHAAPTPPPSTSCANCGEQMNPGDSWCSTCGQKTYKGPPGFWSLIGEFFETVLSLDNRLFRTLWALIVPGRLTNNFLTGKQKPYFHPLRLFFVSGVLMVATYSFYTAREVGDSMDNDLEQRRAQAYKHQFGENLRMGVDSIKTSFSGDSSVAVASDSLLSLLGHSTAAQANSMSIDYLSYKGGLTFEEKRVHILRDDYQLLTPSKLADKYKIEGVFDQHLFKQLTRLNHLNLSGLTAIIGQAIWGLLLLVPLAAGMLKLFYIRRKRRYVEHFVFTLHVHAFIFLMQFLAALSLLLFNTPWFLISCSVLSAIYFLFALKRVYKQGWGKTLIKATMMFFGYNLLFSFALGVAGLLAILLF